MDEATPTGRRFTVSEAAEVLGISGEAVRARIKRGTLEVEREGDSVFVRLDADQMPTPRQQGDDRAVLIEELRAQLEAEREARRRADTIIAQMARATEAQAQTIRELEAPEEREQSEPEARPSWWHWLTGN